MNNSGGWVSDFRDFLTVQESPPPSSISHEIDKLVHTDLNPSFVSIILKQLVVLVIAAPLVLMFCPQFGLGSSERSFFPMNIFMSLGHTGCMLACGSLFMGIVVSVSLFVFRPEEVRAIRESRFLYFSLLSLASLGAFVCAGAEVFLELGAAWFVGATAISLIIYEVNYWLRLRGNPKTLCSL